MEPKVNRIPKETEDCSRQTQSTSAAAKRNQQTQSANAIDKRKTTNAIDKRN
jgi:hypothetical protein